MNIDWRTIDTDQLIATMPDNEDNRWEYKALGLMDDDNKFKTKLGKQVSAFANSLGGHIILGLSDDRKNWQPIPDKKGDTRMKDWLAKVVCYSVESPLQTFQVHPVPITGGGGSIYVIEVGDSPAAPHQAKDKIYYYRIDGHSDPAPHVHLQLLRDRYTKSMLRVDSVDFAIHEITEHEGTTECMLEMCLKIEVVNDSLLSAQNWGVQITQTTPFIDTKSIMDHNRWFGNGYGLSTGVHFHGEKPAVLLPGERSRIDAIVSAYTGYSHHSAFLNLWEKFGVLIRPVSHNHVGRPFDFGTWTESEFRVVQRQFVEPLNYAMSTSKMTRDFREVRNNRR